MSGPRVFVSCHTAGRTVTVEMEADDDVDTAGAYAVVVAGANALDAVLRAIKDDRLDPSGSAP